MYSGEYKILEEFRGKKIIVVGIGNFGIDLVIEFSYVVV